MRDGAEWLSLLAQLVVFGLAESRLAFLGIWGWLVCLVLGLGAAHVLAPRHVSRIRRLPFAASAIMFSIAGFLIALCTGTVAVEAAIADSHTFVSVALALFSAVPLICLIMTRESDAIPLERLCAGENVATIADGLCLARSTVATYRKSVYRKAGVHSQCGLVTLVGSERSERLSEVSTFSAFPGTLRIHQTHISEISAGTGVAKIIRSEYWCTLRIITTRPGPATPGARRTRGPPRPHDAPGARHAPTPHARFVARATCLAHAPMRLPIRCHGRSADPYANMGAPPTPMQTGSGRAPRRRHPGP